MEFDQFLGLSTSRGELPPGDSLLGCLKKYRIATDRLGVLDGAIRLNRSHDLDASGQLHALGDIRIGRHDLSYHFSCVGARLLGLRYGCVAEAAKNRAQYE